MSKRERPAEGRGAQTSDLVALAGRDEVSAEAGTSQAPVRLPTLAALEEIERRQQEQGFDWECSDSIFIWEQPRTAVYRTKRDQVAVRQDCPDDPCLIFNVTALPDLIRALARQIDGDNTGRTWEAINQALCDFDL